MITFATIACHTKLMFITYFSPSLLNSIEGALEDHFLNAWLLLLFLYNAHSATQNSYRLFIWTLRGVSASSKWWGFFFFHFQAASQTVDGISLADLLYWKHSQLKSMTVNVTKKYNHWIGDYHYTKVYPVCFDHLLCREHIANLKEMLLTLSFEKAIFSNSKKRQFTNAKSKDTIMIAGPGEKQYHQNDSRDLSFSENEQYFYVKVWYTVSSF